MIPIFTCSCLIIAVLCYKKYKFVLNPVSTMFMIWAVLVPLSAYGFYGTRIPQTKTYIIILVGLIAYAIGIILGSNNIRIVVGKKQSDTYIEGYSINYVFLYTIMTISLVYFMIQAVEVIRILASGNTYAYIRMLVSADEENVLQGSRILSAIRAFIAVPTTYLAIAVLPIELFYGKRKKLFIFEALLLMFLFVFTNGARSVIMWIAIYMLFIYLIYRRNHKITIRIDKKYKRRLIWGGIVLFILMLYMTISRKGSDVDIIRQMYIYFVAPLPHFDHYIDVVDASHKYGMGFSSFYGLVYPVLYVIRIITGSYSKFITDIYYMSFEMLEPGYNLGNNIYMNAFVTIFYQPYLDGRFLGVILILAVFGYLCSTTFKRAIYNEDLRSMLLYSLLLQKILFSFVRFYFTQQAQAMCFIFALFAINRVYCNSGMRGVD